MHIHLDVMGGIAGDMFIAAVLDARPDLAVGMLDAVQAVGIPPGWKIELRNHHDGVLRGKRFVVAPPLHAEQHDHKSLRDVLRLIHAAPLERRIRQRAESIFQLLAEAEADVHGVEPGDVTFHEIGAWDSIVDIVAAAYLVEALGPATWRTGPIPLGGGRVGTAHGPMPVPTPATERLLRGFELIDDGIGGERVTPTGAAILRHVVGEPQASTDLPGQPLVLNTSGTGFGTQTLRGISNTLRVLLFDSTEPGAASDTIGLIHFEVDDQTGEDLAIGLDLLRAREGVLDVLQIAALGKKGRMMAHVQVLCRRELLPEIIDACFLETTTIGLRWTVSTRAKLARRTAVSDASNSDLAVKLTVRPGGSTSAKAEADDVRGISGWRNRYRLRSGAEDEARRTATSVNISDDQPDEPQAR